MSVQVEQRLCYGNESVTFCSPYNKYLNLVLWHQIVLLSSGECKSSGIESSELWHWQLDGWSLHTSYILMILIFLWSLYSYNPYILMILIFLWSLYYTSYILLVFVVSEYKNPPPHLWENEKHNSDTLSRGNVLWFNISSSKKLWNNTRRIINKTLITWANLIERIEELHEILRVHYGEKILSSSWKAFSRMKVVE